MVLSREDSWCGYSCVIMCCIIAWSPHRHASRCVPHPMSLHVHEEGQEASEAHSIAHECSKSFLGKQA